MKQEEWGDDGSGESLPTTSPSYSSLPDARMEEAANLLGTSTLPTPHFDTPLRLTPPVIRGTSPARSQLLRVIMWPAEPYTNVALHHMYKCKPDGCPRVAPPHCRLKVIILSLHWLASLGSRQRT